MKVYTSAFTTEKDNSNITVSTSSNGVVISITTKDGAAYTHLSIEEAKLYNKLINRALKYSDGKDKSPEHIEYLKEKKKNYKNAKKSKKRKKQDK